MRHRMITGTGFGNSDPVLMDNKGKLTKAIKAMMKEAFDLYKPLKYGCDYKLEEDGVLFGREPAYQYESLFLICLKKDKSRSYMVTGKAWGSYGSQIVSTTRHYFDYKYRSKFTKGQGDDRTTRYISS